MSKLTLVIPVCSVCGDYEVVKHALAKWDDDKQRWVPMFRSVYYCPSDGQVEVMWKEKEDDPNT